MNRFGKHRLSTMKMVSFTKEMRLGQVVFVVDVSLVVVDTFGLLEGLLVGEGPLESGLSVGLPWGRAKGLFEYLLPLWLVLLVLVSGLALLFLLLFLMFLTPNLVKPYSKLALRTL